MSDEHPWKCSPESSHVRDPRDWLTGDEPVTPRQRRALLRLGYRDELETMTKGEAGLILRRELSTLRGRPPQRHPEDAR